MKNNSVAKSSGEVGGYVDVFGLGGYAGLTGDNKISFGFSTQASAGVAGYVSTGVTIDPHYRAVSFLKCNRLV